MSATKALSTAPRREQFGGLGRRRLQHHDRVPTGARRVGVRGTGGWRPRAGQGRRTLPRITLQQLLDLEWRRRPGDRVVVLLGHCGERAYLPNRTQRHDRAALMRGRIRAAYPRAIAPPTSERANSTLASRVGSLPDGNSLADGQQIREE